MAQSTIERVLSCPNLPSLPGVAMKVLELTRDPQVSIASIAAAVQTDPALATKVLRTVNSSFYALATPCPNISRALSMLGLNTVKSLVLSFSLVDTTKQLGLGAAFDMEGYWWRAVYSASAARCIATATRVGDPDDAFVGALLQDIGMLACFAALRDEYTTVLAGAGDDHGLIARAEREALGFDHAGVGRRLAERWRLPPVITDCIGWHHLPDEISNHRDMVRVVALSGLAAAALGPVPSAKKLGAFVVALKHWFEMDLAQAKTLLEQSAKGAAELSKLMEVRTGDRPDVGTILSEAHERMVATQEQIQHESAQLKRDNLELAKKTITDGLTGAFNRAHFDGELRNALERSRAANRATAVVFVDADRFKSVNDRHGHQAGDAVLMELAKRLRAVGDRVGTLCRYGGEEFALILPAADTETARKAGELLRRCVEQTPFDLSAYDMAGLTLPVTISLGVAVSTPGTPTGAWTPEQLTHAADEAMYAAKQAGRNCVRCAGDAPPVVAGVVPAAWRALVVEDDPFAVRLMQEFVRGIPMFTAEFVPSAEDALALLDAAGDQRPAVDVMLVDLRLPGMSGAELIRVMRRRRTASKLVLVLMSADVSGDARHAGIEAGADSFIDKLAFSTDPEGTFKAISALMTRALPLAA